MNPARNQRRTLEGTVTSDRCSKTITVLVERMFRHPKYGKFVRRQKKVHAHDENGDARNGDRVEIRACRPLSATKRWTLVRVIERSANVDAGDFTPEIPGMTRAAGPAGGAS